MNGLVVPFQMCIDSMWREALPGFVANGATFTTTDSPATRPLPPPIAPGQTGAGDDILEG